MPRANKQKVIEQLKDVPCTDCGKRYHPWAMEFDHVTQKKTGNVSRLPLDAALREVGLTEVVCANCHRVRTAARRLDAHEALSDDADLELD